MFLSWPLPTFFNGINVSMMYWSSAFKIWQQSITDLFSSVISQSIFPKKVPHIFKLFFVEVSILIFLSEFTFLVNSTWLWSLPSVAPHSWHHQQIPTVKIKLYLTLSLSSLVLAHAEKESCLVLELKSCGPHVLYSEEFSTVYVHG